MTLPPDLSTISVTTPSGAKEPLGEFLTLEGEEYYRISSYHRMRPFLMTIASDTDLWTFITSGGGLAAGRVDADGSLFPYETVDKLHDSHHHAGPVTLFRVRQEDGPELLWQPFSERSEEGFRIERNLYKNTIGNKIIFEEVNPDLGLAFRYRWSGCDAFGHVRTAMITNSGSGACKIEMLDGLRNVLPYGSPLRLYQQSSSLVEAYRRTEYDPDTGLGIFSLTAKIVDRAEPAEELRANTIWSHGLDSPRVCLSIDGAREFRRGGPVPDQEDLKGARGNYLLMSGFELKPGEGRRWHLAADVGRSHVQIATLRRLLLGRGELESVIEESLREAGQNLARNVGSADGIQLTGSPEAAAHHFANVLFNNMRGGVFADNDRAPSADLLDFLRTRNRRVAGRQQAYLRTLPVEFRIEDLMAAVRGSGDLDFQRLCHEYLPIFFSRRHGDPSRPWNRFEIRVRNSDGSRALRYEGNWRDIFQNWEALTLSFPGFLPNIIAKFVNASTVDGFNPYRLTRDGVEWEVVDPEDPWSYIGYWGDHQIIYLLKFLESAARFSPGLLEGLLGLEIFCYAEVPYRVKPYPEILENPRKTIRYDEDLAARIEDRVLELGTDGKLVPNGRGLVYHVNLLEKLLVPALSKLSNFVPDGGIWMNTQRPEWNDANNALVGNGVSVVTLAYLRRYLRFLETLLDTREDVAEPVSTEVVRWFQDLRTILEENRSLLAHRTLHDRDRKQILDAAGGAFSDYRERVYAKGFSGKEDLSFQGVAAFCRTAIEYLDHAIRANRREDGLYHAYNLLQVSTDGEEATVRPLFEMLEGQVAALSSGLVDAPEAVRLLSRLFESRLYREIQNSFLLYPERDLPGFLEKNVVPDERVRAVPLLGELLREGEGSILARDASGICRFQGDLSNALDLAAALDRLAPQDRWSELVMRDRQAILELFEEVFLHRSFTGRSGVMYGYEGLGCVYWHMVSKLLLAVQEIAIRAAHDEDAVFAGLAKAYYRIRAGLGFEKTVAEYGAFPADPYSHTPPQGGARQPGMTGQVKEEILTRFGELGVEVMEGTVLFRPVLLKPEEFLETSETYRFYDLAGEAGEILVPPGGLAFTFCQVPVVYEQSRHGAWISVTTGDGTSTRRPGNRLDAATSRVLFQRLGGISRIDVGVPESLLFRS